MIAEAVSKVKYGLETMSLAQRGVGWLPSLVGLNGAIPRGKNATIRTHRPTDRVPRLAQASLVFGVHQDRSIATNGRDVVSAFTLYPQPFEGETEELDREMSLWSLTIGYCILAFVTSGRSYCILLPGTTVVGA